MARLDRTLAVALALHAGAFALLKYYGVHTEPARTAQDPDGPSLEPIDVTIDEVPVAPPDDVLAEEHDTANASPGAVASLEGDGSRVRAEGESDARTPRASMHAEKPGSAAAPESGTHAKAAPAGHAPGEVAAGVTFGAPDIGTGGDNPFLARGALPDVVGPAERRSSSAPERLPTLAEQKTAASRRVKLSIQQAAREQEHDLGLGPEGPVRAALGDATTATTAPVTGRAVFFARADHDGAVTSVSVLECDGGRTGWAEAAGAALRALGKKRLRMPSYAKTAEMRIEVTSGWKMPNGHDPGTNVTAMQIPVARGVEGKNGTHMSFMNVKIDRVRLNKDVSIPVPATKVDIVATNGDAVNIGAKPSRIVHTRVLDVKML